MIYLLNIEILWIKFHKWDYSERKKNNDCISLHCFINVEDCPSKSTKLPYSPTSVNKKEVAYNDNTGTI